MTVVDELVLSQDQSQIHHSTSQSAVTLNFFNVILV